MGTKIDFSQMVAPDPDPDFKFRYDEECAEYTTNLLYWYPVLQELQIPTPETKIVLATDQVIEELVRASGDGAPMTEVVTPFFTTLKKCAEDLGFPCFLRSGYTSAKHDWENTCLINSADDIVKHVLQICLFSLTVGIIDLSTWVVRKMLPVVSCGNVERYGKMPIVKEFRVFAYNGKFICIHPYWPYETLADEFGAPVMTQKAWSVLSDFNRADYEAMVGMAMRVSEALPEHPWSIDFIKTKNGWYLTDMARESRSYHWPSCPCLKDNKGE